MQKITVGVFSVIEIPYVSNHAWLWAKMLTRYVGQWSMTASGRQKSITRLSTFGDGYCRSVFWPHVFCTFAESSYFGNAASFRHVRVFLVAYTTRSRLHLFLT
jgi:hypothetical protein